MKLKWFKRVLCSCFIMLALLAASEGAVRYVTPGGAGSKSGDSWANAMGVVGFRKALEVGVEGEYWVAAGTYTPHDSDPDKSFVLKTYGTALYGGFAGDETKRDERDWEANVTILSGAIGGSLHSYHVVRAENVFSTVILDGFTITGGNANGSSPYDKHGGGMYIVNGSPTVTNCTFSENAAGFFGGGMYIYDNSSPTVTNCTFSENVANLGGGGIGMDIGGSGNPEVTNCTFSENEVKWYGGGIIIRSGNLTLTNCTFSENETNNYNYGGGMYIAVNCNPTVTNTIFWGAGSATGQVFVEQGGTLTITYSVVDTALFPGEGNTNVDPRLGPLADNGGPTQTCALLEGSSAIDSGTDTGAPSTDQRGVSRPQGSGYDMGAYEKEEAPVPPKPGSSGGGGCATGPSSPWMLALLAPLAPIALRKRPGRRGR